ncbi:MAG: hypothetical protein WCQ50_01555 [Spirochaetota bacterium]
MVGRTVTIARALGVSVEYLVTGKEPSGLPLRIEGIARRLAKLDDPNLMTQFEALLAIAEGGQCEAPEANPGVRPA